MWKPKSAQAFRYEVHSVAGTVSDEPMPQKL